MVIGRTAFKKEKNNNSKFSTGMTKSALRRKNWFGDPEEGSISLVTHHSYQISSNSANEEASFNRWFFDENVLME